jgi:hypothetical protein
MKLDILSVAVLAMLTGSAVAQPQKGLRGFVEKADAFENADAFLTHEEAVHALRRMSADFNCAGTCITDPNPPTESGYTNCFQLTDDLYKQVGAVWGATPFSLLDPFDISAKLYFGLKDLDGADGIAFVIQNQLGNSAAEHKGGGLGYMGLGEYFAAEVDTFQNPGFSTDIEEDHIDVSTRTLSASGPKGYGIAKPANAAGNVEDGTWHDFRVTYDLEKVKVYFGTGTDPVYTSEAINIRNEFAGTEAYFGFTAATGHLHNVHKVCNINFGTATPVLDLPEAEPEPEEDSVESLLCENFAAHANTAITFAAPTTGRKAEIFGGDIGSWTGVTGSAANLDLEAGYEIVGGIGVNGASTAFGQQKVLEWQDSMVINTGATLLPDTFIHGTFTAGEYRSGSTFIFALDRPTIYLDGESTSGLSDSKWHFQAGSAMTTCAGCKIELINGAQAKNVLWSFGTALTLGANSILEGSVTAGSSITMGMDSEIRGCALAQTAITLDNSAIINRNVPSPLTR